VIGTCHQRKRSHLVSRTVSRRRPVRAVVNVLFAVLMAFGLSAALTPPAHAAAQVECWTPTANGEGAGFLRTTVYLRNGPYEACGETFYGPSGHLVHFHCWTINSYGNTWWYVRIAGTESYGWVSDFNLLGNSNDENGDGQIIFYQC
jgi:hypothetical protein